MSINGRAYASLRWIVCAILLAAQTTLWGSNPSQNDHSPVKASVEQPKTSITSLIWEKADQALGWLAVTALCTQAKSLLMQHGLSTGLFSWENAKSFFIPAGVQFREHPLANLVITPGIVAAVWLGARLLNKGLNITKWILGEASPGARDSTVKTLARMAKVASEVVLSTQLDKNHPLHKELVSQCGDQVAEWILGFGTDLLGSKEDDLKTTIEGVGKLDLDGVVWEMYEPSCWSKPENKIDIDGVKKLYTDKAEFDDYIHGGTNKSDVHSVHEALDIIEQGNGVRLYVPGPTSTGKSFLAKSIAAALKNAILLNVHADIAFSTDAYKDMSKKKFEAFKERLMEVIGQNSNKKIVLNLDDVEELLKKEDRNGDGNNARSNLQNFVVDIGKHSNVIFIMSTNVPCKDVWPALLARAKGRDTEASDGTKLTRAMMLGIALPDAGTREYIIKREIQRSDANKLITIDPNQQVTIGTAKMTLVDLLSHFSEGLAGAFVAKSARDLLDTVIGELSPEQKKTSHWYNPFSWHSKYRFTLNDPKDPDYFKNLEIIHKVIGNLLNDFIGRYEEERGKVLSQIKETGKALFSINIQAVNGTLVQVQQTDMNALENECKVIDQIRSAGHLTQMQKTLEKLEHERCDFYKNILEFRIAMLQAAKNSGYQAKELNQHVSELLKALEGSQGRIKEITKERILRAFTNFTTLATRHLLEIEGVKEITQTEELIRFINTLKAEKTVCSKYTDEEFVERFEKHRTYTDRLFKQLLESSENKTLNKALFTDLHEEINSAFAAWYTSCDSEKELLQIIGKVDQKAVAEKLYPTKDEQALAIQTYPIPYKETENAQRPVIKTVPYEQFDVYKQYVLQKIMCQKDETYNALQQLKETYLNKTRVLYKASNYTPKLKNPSESWIDKQLTRKTEPLRQKLLEHTCKLRKDKLRQQLGTISLMRKRAQDAYFKKHKDNVDRLANIAQSVTQVELTKAIEGAITELAKRGLSQANKFSPSYKQKQGQELPEKPFTKEELRVLEKKRLPNSDDPLRRKAMQDYVALQELKEILANNLIKPQQWADDKSLPNKGLLSLEHTFM